MENLKKYILVSLILMASVVIAVQTTTISDNTSESLTFSGEDIIRNITLSKDANVSGAFIDLTGLGGVNAWNLTEFYNTSSIDVEYLPTDIFFKPDGERLYQSTYDNIYQYSCTDAWNLSSCSYDNININPAVSSMRTIFFKPDGTKLYIGGRTAYHLYQYSCTDAWNLSSCSYDNINISVPINLRDIFFKPDGTKLYTSLSTTGNPIIYQYSCTDAWNLSSCSYDNINISSQDSVPYNIFFKPDGTKLYESGFNSYHLYQYACTDAWNLSSCSYDNVNKSYEMSDPISLFFKPDGERLYQIIAYKMYEFKLTPFFSDNNFTLTINDTEIWSYSGILNTTNKTNDFSSALNTALNSGACDCNNCSLLGNNCNINITFTSALNETLQYSNINITWTESIAPNVTITKPTGEYSTTEIPYNISAIDNWETDFCTYWVTRGASLEVANTSVTCSNEITGSLYVSSQNTNYVFHFFANDTSGNSNKTNQTFSTSENATIIVAPSGGGSSSTIVVGDEADWTMEAGVGSKTFNINLVIGTTQVREVLFKNLGEEERKIKLSCEDLNGTSGCKYVTLENSEVTLPLIQDIKTSTEFTIIAPELAKIGEYTFNIVGIDDNNKEERVTVFLTIKETGFIAKLSARTEGGFPYLLIAIISFISTIILSSLILNKTKLGAKPLIAFVSSSAITYVVVLIF